MSTVTSAIEHIGLTPIAKRFGYRPSAVQKWKDSGRLPQSELSGLTNYAETIEELCRGKFTAEQLIRDTRSLWSIDPPKKRGGRKGKRCKAKPAA